MLCGDGVAAPAASASTFPFPGASLPVWVIYPTATTEQRSRASLHQDSRAGTDFDSISASARNLHRDSESRDSERCSPTQAHDKKDLCGCERISPKVRAYQILIRHPFDVAFFACLMSGFILRQGFIFFSLFRRFPFFNTTRSYFGFPANHQAGSFCSPSFLRRSLSFSLALSLSLSLGLSPSVLSGLLAQPASMRDRLVTVVPNRNPSGGNRGQTNLICSIVTYKWIFVVETPSFWHINIVYISGHRQPALFCVFLAHEWFTPGPCKCDFYRNI